MIILCFLHLFLLLRFLCFAASEEVREVVRERYGYEQCGVCTHDDTHHQCEDEATDGLTTEDEDSQDNHQC